MSLKTDFYDGATGLNSKVTDSYDLGKAWVVSNLTTISTSLIAQSALGMKVFILTISTTDNLTNMMSNQANNLIAKGYMAGVTAGLADEEIYSFDCEVGLVGTVATAYVTLNFTL